MLGRGCANSTITTFASETATIAAYSGYRLVPNLLREVFEAQSFACRMCSIQRSNGHRERVYPQPPT